MLFTDSIQCFAVFFSTKSDIEDREVLGRGTTICASLCRIHVLIVSQNYYDRRF